MPGIKKLTCCIAAAALLLSLIACGKDPGKETEMTGDVPAGSVTAEAASEAETPAPGMTKTEEMPPETKAADNAATEAVKAETLPEETTAGPEAAAQVRQSPPKLTVLCEGKSYPAGFGTYSWSWPIGDGTSRGIEVDTVHPLQRNSYTYIPVRNGAVLTLQFEGDVPPDTVSVSCWDSRFRSSGDVSAAEAERREIEPSSDGSYQVPTDTSYVFLVRASWGMRLTDAGENSHGSAGYVFMTVPAH